MITIAIPLFNESIKVLISELYQQCKDLKIIFEILILDDASSQIEGSEFNIYKSLPNCTYIQHQKNKGRIASRLHLAKSAKFEWILFLDADVMPKNHDFIKKMIQHINQGIDMIFGGIDYPINPPDPTKILRWKYGRKREVKSLKFRKQNPYTTIVSQHFLIRKTVAIEVLEAINIKAYGLDVLFTYELQKRNLDILHIDNPTIHLGIENSAAFLKKALKAVETTYYLQEQKLIPHDFKPIQRAFLMLKKYKLIVIFECIINISKGWLAKQLYYSNPNLLFFDCYRLYYFISLKK